MLVWRLYEPRACWFGDCTNLGYADQETVRTSGMLVRRLYDPRACWFGDCTNLGHAGSVTVEPRACWFGDWTNRACWFGDCRTSGMWVRLGRAGGRAGLVGCGVKRSPGSLRSLVQRWPGPGGRAGGRGWWGAGVGRGAPGVGRGGQRELAVECREVAVAGGSPGVTGQARATPAPCPRHPSQKKNACSPRHARTMPAPRPRQCSVTPGHFQTPGRNGSGRGPDAGRTIDFKETDAGRTRT
eukprot:gene24444-biopygen11901